MTQLLQIKLLDNNRSHQDLLFCINGLTAELEFDSYYFYLASNDIKNFQDLKYSVAQLLEYWLTKTKELKEGQSIYLPIDFSDEYTGCLKVSCLGKNVELTYGTSSKPGFSIDPTDPSDYCYKVNDFHDAIGKSIVVTKDEFIISIGFQIEELKNI